MTPLTLRGLEEVSAMLKCGRVNDAREELDRIIRAEGGFPPDPPPMRRVERERARAAA